MPALELRGSLHTRPVTGQLSRGDYDMKFNQTLGSGNMLVADKVKLNLDISAAKQAQPQPSDPPAPHHGAGQVPASGLARALA